jgi:ribosomal protein S18 acetylase RimI-like enzyme
VETLSAGRDPRDVDAAAQIWAEATAARDGDSEVARLEISRPVIDAVLQRSPQAFVLVSRDSDGNETGFAAVEALTTSTKTRATAQVSYFGVRPGRWGLGIGETLLRELQRRLTAAGYSRVELSVYTDNTRAAALYERLGWTAIGAPTAHPRSGKLEQRYELLL